MITHFYCNRVILTTSSGLIVRRLQNTSQTNSTRQMAGRRVAIPAFNATEFFRTEPTEQRMISDNLMFFVSIMKLT